MSCKLETNVKYPVSRMSFVEKSIRELAIQAEHHDGKLPSTSKLCTMLSTSVSTVNRAISTLKKEGLITARQGKGFFVNGNPKRPATGMIAILAAQTIHFDHPVLGKSAAGIQRVLQHHHLQTVLLGMDADGNGGSADRRGKNSLLAPETLVNPNFFDAVIILGLAASAIPRPLQPAAIMRLAATIPVGIIDGQYMGGDKNIVQCWNGFDSGMLRAIIHLVELGHRDIAIILGARDNDTARMQRRGAEMAAAVYPDKKLNLRIIHASCSEEAGSREFARILDGGRHPTALIAGADDIARGAYRVLTANRLQVPRDISLISFNQWANIETIPMPVTSVMVDFNDSATRCAEEIVRLLNGERATADDIMVPVDFAIRASTAAPHRQPTSTQA